jgi:hypothetical protein
MFERYSHCARYSPARILNDWTKCQPWIDKNNRFRQRILAIEERFTLQSFPAELALSVMVGMSVSSAYKMFKFYVNDTYVSLSCFVEAVAFDGMLNDFDYDQTQPGRDVRSGIGKKPKAPSVVGSSSEGSGSATCVGRHTPVPVRTIEAWEGSERGRCGVCNSKTMVSYVCNVCSSAESVVWLHLPSRTWKCQTISTPCYSKHEADPSEAKRSYASESHQAAAKKRARDGGSSGRRH